MVLPLLLCIYSDLFRTSERDMNVNLTSSYLDLSPLYGSRQEEQNLVRTFKDGKLKPDTFCETRLELFPPGVAALLVCFNRFHNYAAQQLAMINEGDRFPIPNKEAFEKHVRASHHHSTEAELQTKISKAYTEATTKLDDDLFQTARLYVSPCMF
jgi:hypothetical protein